MRSDFSLPVYFTWYDYNPGTMTRKQAMSWAAGLNAGGVPGWRKELREDVALKNPWHKPKVRW